MALGAVYETNVGTRAIRDVSSKIYYAEPDAYPFTALLSMLATEKTGNYKYEHYERSALCRQTKAAGAPLIMLEEPLFATEKALKRTGM